MSERARASVAGACFFVLASCGWWAPDVLGQDLDLRLTKSGDDVTATFGHAGTPPLPTAFHLYRGELGRLEEFEQRGGPDGRCDVPAAAATTDLIGEATIEGSHYYLVSSLLPSGESDLGVGSTGTARPNRHPCTPVVADCGSLGSGGPSGTTLNINMDVLGTAREYHRYVPDGLDPDVPVPMLVFLHGLGSNHDDAISLYYDIPRLADDNGFIAVFPNSLLLPDCGAIEGGKHWDVCENPPNPDTSQDIVFIRQMIDETSAQYNICSDRIYTHGHSYGGFFSFYTAMTLPDQIAAFAEHSGGMFGMSPVCWPRCIPAGIRKVPGFLIHSTDDSVVEYASSVRLEAAMDASAHEQTFITLMGWDHTFSNATNQEVWDWLMARPLP